MPFGWAVALGAANYVNKRVMESRMEDQNERSAMAEDIRMRKKADDMAAIATSQLVSSGRENEHVFIPDYTTGGIKHIPLNQYTTTKSTTPAFSPDPDIAWYNALSTKENKIDGSKHRFVQVNPALTPELLKKGQFEDGTPIVANRDYVLFENTAPTKGERAISGISNWRNKLLDSQEGLKLALAQAKNGDNRALSKIMSIGSDLVRNWQGEQRPQELVAGNAYFEANPFGESGPLSFMKEHEIFQDEEFFKPFMSAVAEQTPYEFINSLNEMGYDVPINNPVTYTLDGNAVTVALTGNWDDLKVPVAQDGTRTSSRRATEWSPEFQNTIGSWAQRSGRSQYEWMRLLNGVAEKSTAIKDGREAYDRIKLFEENVAKLGQPVDFTSGVPVYRNSWGIAVKDEFRTLLNELNLEGEDAANLVGALMPQDMYKGIRTKVYNVNKSAHYFIAPGTDLDQLRSEKGDLERNIRLATQIQNTVPAGTGFTADLKSLKEGAKSQIDQLTRLFGSNPEGVGSVFVDVFKGFFSEEELDVANIDKMQETERDALMLKMRKFAVIQLMYSFAKGMGGSGSDRLSDQDAKNALEALQVSGLLNSQAGMNLVMETLIQSMEKRRQVLGGITSPRERDVIGGLFLQNMYEGRQGFEFTDVIMDAWTTQFNANPSKFRDPKTWTPGSGAAKKPRT